MKKQILSIPFIATVMVLSACTKELPMDKLFKGEAMPKSKIDIASEFIYSASMGKASRTSPDAFPYMFADSKRVKLEWGEKSLKVVETERDARFGENKTNDKLVLEIPVTHSDYQCAKDKYGECTNKEEVVDTKWDKKSYFEVQSDAPKSGQLDLLPMLGPSDEEDQKCYEEVSARIKDFSVEKEAINFSVERTFKTNIKCLSTIDTLADTNVSAVFHYSMVKASAILSPGFKTVEYPNVDEQTFGYFNTKRSSLDVGNNKTQSGEKTIMNHWNPERKEIIFHLSDEFKKPENATIKKLTQQTIETLNHGLGEAGAKFKVSLQDPSGKVPGDIRNSMIVLVEDPVASSVIGYGPQTEDPVTGEIISARTVMFLGTIKSNIKIMYDEILKKKQEAKEEAAKAVAKSPMDLGLASRVTVGEKIKAKLARATFTSKDLESIVVSTGASASAEEKAAEKKGSSAKEIAVKLNADQIIKDVRNYKKNINPEYVLGDAVSKFRYQHQVKNCALGHGADFSPTSVSTELLAKFPDDAKPWVSLTDAEKQNAIDILLPEVWVPTLIHELGHNLGLRHNFEGSEDKNNFYSDDELKARKMDHRAVSSSVMDYVEDVKALQVLGKYDIAALKFAYAKKVETAEGKIIDVEENLTQMKKANSALALKKYGYCTDEHTGINAGCRRFDEGTSLVDIAKGLIKSIEERYTIRNKRNDASDMSLLRDYTHYRRMFGLFVELRAMQEVYERVKYLGKVRDNDPIWVDEPDYADIKGASLLAGQYLMKVLSTPDLTCLVAREENPNVISDMVPLHQIRKGAVSCLDLKLNSPFIMLGEAGKLINAGKDPDSTNNYVDQIDVRGYWLAKLAASRVLFARSLNNSSFDKNTDNFMDRPEFFRP
ncbi:MAG: zinc-dependent metalloprotease, partial [Pseudobdellovibrionaceae bacterium]